ncbi:MAG: hypothetical protein KatS3mg019_0931 [Fimbriimonadales bacterium]|nr:MAG: hypothetical protein KatS3mg019_0931 [Fimbriimonadales bacterium]
MNAREILEVLQSDPEAAQLFEMPKQVEQLREEMNARFDAMQESVDQRFDAMQEYVDQRFDAMQEYVDQRFDAMQESVDQRFDAMQEYVDQRFDTMQEYVDQGFAESNKRHDRAEQRLDRIEKDLGYLKGRERERWFRDNAKNIFGRFMKRPQVVDLPELEEILGENILTQEHRELLAEADLIVRGIDRDTQREVFAVLEASWKIDANDVERAHHRATVLRQYGVHAVPVVGGVETIETLVPPEDVVTFLDGKAYNALLLR